MAATTLTIRHSRFATLTLAKLVASLALHPPISATGSGGLRASPPPAAEPLLKEKPFGKCVSQQSPIATPDFRIQPSPPVARRCNRRGLAKPDHRGKRQKRAGGACSRPSGSSFSLPRGPSPTLFSSFIQSTFTSHTGSLLLSSLKKVTFLSYPSSPSPPILKERIITYDAG